MNQPNNKYALWIAKIISRSFRSRLSPVVPLFLGGAIAYAIWQGKITLAIVFVITITLGISAFITYAIAIEKEQLSQTASLSDLESPEYVTLDSKLVWIIENESGSVARLEKTKIIQPLKSLDVVKEFWWGDGNPPVDQDYTLKPPAKEIGRRFRQGSKRVVLIVLDRIYSPDETFELTYIRKLIGAFKSDSEWVETFVASETEKLNLAVIFPDNRPFKSAKAVSRLAETATEYLLKEVDIHNGQFYSTFTDDGRVMLAWSIIKPELGRTYTIEWDW